MNDSTYRLHAADVIKEKGIQHKDSTTFMYLIDQVDTLKAELERVTKERDELNSKKVLSEKEAKDLDASIESAELLVDTSWGIACGFSNEIVSNIFIGLNRLRAENKVLRDGLDKIKFKCADLTISPMSGSLTAQLLSDRDDRIQWAIEALAKADRLRDGTDVAT